MRWSDTKVSSAWFWGEDGGVAGFAVGVVETDSELLCKKECSGEGNSGIWKDVSDDDHCTMWDTSFSICSVSHHLLV